MTATIEDIAELKMALKEMYLKEIEALEATRGLCHLSNKFNGLIEPAASWKPTDISNGVTKYLDDMDEITVERIKRVWASTLTLTLPPRHSHLQTCRVLEGSSHPPGGFGSSISSGKIALEN